MSPSRAAVIAAALTTMLVAPVPAHAEGAASVTGVVRDAESLAPIEGACVTVSDTVGTDAVQGCTDASGSYEVTGLPAGTYTVGFRAAYHMDQWAYGKPQVWEADPISLGEGQQATVSADLDPAGMLDGTVTDAATGEPLSGICMSPQESSGTSCTDGDGYYELPLRPGDYTISFTDYTNAYTGRQEPATVTAYQRTTLDVTLVRAASISGTVTDATTGAPVTDICPLAVRTPAGSETYGSGGCTGEDGSYTINGVPPGSYYVLFSDFSGAHPRTWYAGTTDPDLATPVPADAGARITGVDVAVTPAGAITGTVTDAITHEPLAGVCTFAFDARGRDVADLGDGICSGADGRYTVRGLPTGSYRLLHVANDGDHLDTWSGGAADQSDATSVPVVAGTVREGVDAALHRGGRISGRIVDARTKAPLAGICATVGLYIPRADEVSVPYRPVCTEADGRYTLRGLPTGKYQVEFYDPTGAYAWQFFPAKPDRSKAPRIGVVMDHETAGIDTRMVPGGQVTGTVVDAATGEPLAGIDVDAFSATTGDWLGTTFWTGSDGRYVLRGFPTTKVNLQFSDGTGRYAGQWAFGATDRASATAVPTTAGGTSTADIALARIG